MDYHLNRQGQTLGVFPLEELRRRRKIGELTGVELVWCPGMPQWQTLDEVLRPSALPGSSPTPPPVLTAPAGNPKSNRTVIWAVTAAIILFLAGLVLVSLPLIRVARNIAKGIDHATRTDQSLLNADANGVSLTSKPIHWTTNTLTATDVRKMQKAFRVRLYLEGYKQTGHRDPAWDAEGLKLIETWISENFDFEPPTNRTSAQVLGDRIAAIPGCDDPVLLMVASQTGIEVNESTSRLERAIKAFQTSRYPAYPQFYATVRLAADFDSKSDRRTNLDVSAVKLFSQALKDSSLTSTDQRDVADHLLDGWGEDFFDRNQQALCRAATEGDDSFEWLALVLKGEHEIDAAWEARGSGWANSVSDKGWQDFARHLSQARNALTHAWKLHPEWPIAAGRMIVVCMGESKADEMRQWFDRAVEAQIDYSPAWNKFAWGMRPRWLGSKEALLALGKTAVQTGRFDTDVPRTFFDRVKEIEADSSLEPGAHLYANEEIWPWMQRMYEGYIKSPSCRANRLGWRSTYATVAYLAGKYDVARDQLEVLNWHPLSENLQGWNRDLSLMPLETAARTSPASNAVERAELNYQEGLLSRAGSSYRQILSTPALVSPARDFIRHRVVLIEQEQALQKGQWLPLLPASTNDLNWMPLSGDASLLPDGSLEVKSGPTGHLLFSRARVGPRVEIKGEFELVSSSDHNFQAGLVLGLPEDRGWSWYAFRMKRNSTQGQLASFSCGWYNLELHHPIALSEGTNTFYLRLDNDTVTASVNGVEVFHSVTPMTKLYVPGDSICLGLGAYNDMNQTVIRYRNVQVRKLDAPKE